ncbi:MAG TPA: DUF2117 domain-containing protein, partial [Methanomicrobiales archaeon]|nr:DUF2117 domain-containing protein [Methanomicrobiales archaeon]
MKEKREADPGGKGPISGIIMVAHGPEVFDCGDAAFLQERIRPCRLLVAGVMGRTAAEESGLAVEFCNEPPSRVAGRLEGPWFLANHGKTPSSGRIFGEIVASRLGEGLVQVECSDRTIYLWDEGAVEVAEAIAERTGFPILKVRSNSQGDPGEREIRGCIPGEAVFVNGIVIGTAISDKVVLREMDGRITPIKGIHPKPHGFEKLERRGRVDLASAWCKSGAIRAAAPRVVSSPPECGRILIVNHCGHEIYKSLGPDVCGVLSIGDDTTAVCGHICSHRGIPIFGVVD